VPPAYQAFIAERRLADHIQFVGYVSEAEKAELLLRARLCLFIPLAEPFGMVMVESMLRGTPVIGSDHGGPGVTIEDRVTGVQVDPFDPTAVARAVVGLYDDRPRWEAMSAAGRTFARSHFLLPAFVERFSAVARRAVEARTPPR
jgi:glycosyltransferase involved in cell wall biosynthesis